MQLSRISKLFLDRDETPAEDAFARRQKYCVTLRCGPDVEKSYLLQLAVLTAANIANRCFPGAVRVALERKLAEAPLLVWPWLKRTFGQELSCHVTLVDSGSDQNQGHDVAFGGAPVTDGSLIVTFDGWIAMVGPGDKVERLPEREYCALSGILAASLAVSELFLSFAEISIEAARRVVGLSLWRPDLEICNASALGVPVEILPRELWALGLGHLGNAYLWSPATLPYSDSSVAQVYLNDFDTVEAENLETGLVFGPSDEDLYKTRVCCAWLEKRGFLTRLVERCFDENFRCRKDEPQLALSGFDSNPVRRHLAPAGFLRVVDSGLGGTKDNFDTISFHTFPNPRTPEELWPDLSAEEVAKRAALQEHLARNNDGYARLGSDECGRYDLAGKSVAVPFVGASAATLVLAETLRLLHGGPAFTDIKLSLCDLARRSAQCGHDYRAQDCAGIPHCISRGGAGTSP